MIKKYYEITIADYSLMEQTGIIRQFNKSIIPTFFLRKRIRKEIIKITELLNENKNKETDDIVWEAQSFAKIKLIEANYLGVLNILGIGTRIEELKSCMTRRLKRKLKYESSAKKLEFYIKNIKKYTGIDIKTGNDLQKVRKELEFRKDKFNENYGKKKTKKAEKKFLMPLALGVFSYINESFNEKLEIIHFVALREKAYRLMELEKTKKH